MTILADQWLEKLMSHGLIDNPDYEMINPASIDVRIGETAIREASHGRFQNVIIPKDGLIVEPGEFLLVETKEFFRIPNGYGADLRLKSTTARRGWDHSLAFWLDPGYEGRPTMEIRNVLQYNSLRLVPGARFAQVMVYRLSGLSAHPYKGRYQGAEAVEGAKD